jgi:hypothetical protein
MKTIVVVLLLISGCGTIQGKFLRDDIQSVRVIQSEASALWSIIGGGTKSCAVIRDPKSEVEVTDIEYENGTCKIKVQKKERNSE